MRRMADLLWRRFAPSQEFRHPRRLCTLSADDDTPTPRGASRDGASKGLPRCSTAADFAPHPRAKVVAGCLAIWLAAPSLLAMPPPSRSMAPIAEAGGTAPHRRAVAHHRCGHLPCIPFGDRRSAQAERASPPD